MHSNSQVPGNIHGVSSTKNQPASSTKVTATSSYGPLGNTNAAHQRGYSHNSSLIAHIENKAKDSSGIRKSLHSGDSTPAQQAMSLNIAGHVRQSHQIPSHQKVNNLSNIGHPQKVYGSTER